MDLKKLVENTKDRTPGNWFSTQDPSKVFVVQSDEGPIPAYCYCNYSQDTLGKFHVMEAEEAQANAVLCAAAPELLDEVTRLNTGIEALKTQLGRITEVCGQDFNEWQSGKVAGLRIALSALTPDEKHSWD